MNKRSKDRKPEVCCKADKQVIPGGKICTRILEIGITAPVIEDKKAKPPLNLSLVVDRSGSMAGEKLRFAKQAAAHLVDLLDTKDRVGIVMYDSEIDVVSPSLELSETNRTRIKSAIQRIASRGSTNLFGGWLKGCEIVAENQNQNNLNRTLLLSDGLANQGVTNLDEIATHTSELFQRGVSTSCFGIGINYNEHLLEAMSNAGGGNFHFLEALSAIPIAFEREFEELINMSLHDAKIELELPDGVTCDLSGGWPGLQSGQTFSVSLGNLFSGRQQKIYFQLHLPSISKAEELALPMKVKAKTIDGKKIGIDQSINFSIVDAAEEEQTLSDAELMERFALVDMADRATEALKLARAGNRRGASNMLYQTMNHHKLNMPAETRQKYEFMAREVNEGMNEMSFKRHHQEEYSNKRAQMDARDYRLELINGHLFTTIEKKRILIDSGIPVSMGSQPEWYFMHEVHQLSEGYLGVSPDQISQLVDASIDIMMGSDILKKYCVLFKLNRNRIGFSNQPLLQSCHKFPLSLMIGVPGVRVDVSGESCEMFLDTGSKLSYISSAFSGGLEPCGTEKDFYPGIGEFETPVYDVDLSLGNLSFTLRCGVLPSILETTLLVSGKKGIIGTQFFEKFAVQLDFPRKYMFLRV